MEQNEHTASVRRISLGIESLPVRVLQARRADDQFAAAGISGDLIRLSVGLENIDDLIEDVTQALEKI